MVALPIPSEQTRFVELWQKELGSNPASLDSRSSATRSCVSCPHLTFRINSFKPVPIRVRKNSGPIKESLFSSQSFVSLAPKHLLPNLLLDVLPSAQTSAHSIRTLFLNKHALSSSTALSLSLSLSRAQHKLVSRLCYV